MYELRVAAPSHSKHYQLENMLLSMDTAKCQVAIICAGVVYGKDNFELQETIFQADEQEEMVLYGDGNNTVPMTNIEELCK